MALQADPPIERALVLGATGFVGRALVPALRRRGVTTRAASRRAWRAPEARLETVACDLLRADTILPALDGVDVAYYLVHSMGAGHEDFRDRDRRAAQAFTSALAQSKVRRIVYLGGVEPQGLTSEHLSSRLEVGDILRSAPVLVLELRAAMIVGAGSASWRISRDLAARLPFMVLPRWAMTRMRPIAIADVVRALVDALDVPLPRSEWFDIPGPDTVTAKDILQRIVALRGRRMHSISVPLLTPALSAHWLRFVTGADFTLARNLVLGMSHDLLPKDERYWELTGHPPRIGFDEAARRALAEADPAEVGWLARGFEALVQRLGNLRPA